jgi:hypothetical protein
MYKIMVKGRKRACYALVDMMPLYSWEKEFLREEGTNEDYTLVFLGACKWGIDYRTVPMANPVPFTEDELNAVQDGDHWGTTLKDKSVLLDCEIFCNSKDIDDGSWSIFEHYNRGKVVADECPQELHIKRGREYDCFEPVSVALALETPIEIKTGRACKVKFERGTYQYVGNYEVGDLVHTEGAMKGQLGRVISVEDNANVTGLMAVVDKVGHADPFIEADMESLWKSYKPKDRKAYLTRLGLEETTAKKKFFSVMDSRWSRFAAEQNDWPRFVEAVRNAEDCVK